MRRPMLIARQARHATGWLGRVIAFIMAHETWSENRRAIEALGIKDEDAILDVGCGHGRSIAPLAARAARGHVAGVDPSELMAEIASRRNRALVEGGRAEVAVASAIDLPFPDERFDKAICVHVIYFWSDPAVAFREIARVLKPGGRLALVFRTNQDAKAVRAFPAEIYRFPSLSEVIASLGAAGFSVERTRKLVREAATTPVLLMATRQHAASLHSSRSRHPDGRQEIADLKLEP